MADERRFTQQGQERKQQLLDCAARLFAERGYDDTRVIDIVREAGAESVAVCLLFSYLDPTPEQRLAEHLRRAAGRGRARR